MRSLNVCLPASLLATALAVCASAPCVLACVPQDAGVDTRPEVAPAAPAAPAAPRDAAELLAAFAKIEGLQARFVEEKRLALLAAPLVREGTLYYLRPGHLTQIVTGEHGSSLRISPSDLVLANAEGEQRIDLAQNADVRRFVVSLVRVFSGDRAALEQAYTLEFDAGDDAPTGSGWTLRLRPRAAPLNELMRELRLEGHGFAVERLTLLEPSGDSTVTRIESADPARVFTDEERLELFGIERA